MLDLFISQYQKSTQYNGLLNKLGFPKLVRFIIRSSANNIMPFIFRFSDLLGKVRHINSHKRKQTQVPELIVSFTSFPARIDKVWLVVESLFNQTIAPDRIILYLSKEQIPSYEQIPNNLLRMQNKGLEIVLVDDDLKPHKKYFYALQDNPQATIVTVDDDNYYPSYFIEQLLYYSSLYPTSIICNRASSITYHENGGVCKYSKWVKARAFSSDYNNFLIGCGGVLYPPHSLHPDVLKKDVFMKLCPLTDDIWLNVMAKINKTPIFVTHNNIVLPVKYKKPQNLYSQNIGESNNDISIRKLGTYIKGIYNFNLFRV